MAQETVQVDASSQVDPTSQPNNASGQQPPATVDELVKQSVVNKPASNNEPPATGDEKFNINDLDEAISGIQDGALKDQMLKLKKSLIAGANKKYQEIAEMKKQLKDGSNIEWTEAEFDRILQDPNFVRVANLKLQKTQLNSNQDPDSLLTEEERQKLNAVSEVQREIEDLKNKEKLKDMQLAIRQQDEELAKKYPNYDVSLLDQTTQDILNEKVQITREDIWKSLDYLDFGKRMFEAGRNLRNEKVQEQLNSISAPGISVTPRSDVPARKEGESPRDYFVRIASERQAQVASRG